MALQTKTLSPTFVGASLMVLAGSLFAVVNASVQQAVMIEGLPPTRVAFWQYAIAFSLALPWVAFRARASFSTMILPLHLLRVALAAIGVQLWISGLAFVPIWQAIALVMLSPFFVTFGAGWLLGERVSGRRWAATATGFAGGMIILAPWSEAFTYQAVLPVGAAAFWAAASLLTKRMTETESAETLTLYLLLLLTPVNAALAFGDGFALDVESTGPLIVAVGLLTALAQYAVVSSYRIADASYLQPFDHLKLPMNVVLGAVLFGFFPPGIMWLGSSLIVAASLYLVWIEKDGRGV